MRAARRSRRAPGDAPCCASACAAVLADLDEADAAAVFAAIRRANPGGLGAAPDQDVAAAPTVGLLEAMALAADRDRIARAYVTDFDEIFEFGLPVLAKRARAYADDPSLAVTTLHMAYLAAFPTATSPANSALATLRRCGRRPSA